MYPTVENGLLEKVQSIPGVLEATYSATRNGHPSVLDSTVEESDKHIPAVVESVVNSGARMVSCIPVESSLGSMLAELVRGARDDR